MEIGGKNKKNKNKLNEKQANIFLLCIFKQLVNKCQKYITNY